MSYTALYRKFRPAIFADVKGQDAIISTLKNQIISGRIGHAYLFCGTRGTGKTTVAKIMAKAVNCENPVEGEPCGVCNACKSIAGEANVNVVEMDAASHNGVEDVRRIEEQIEYSPSEGKYRVYIIDEVHMLSPAAFNALLKTLEEPPSYVVFILATTDVHKLPITILSRCQRYDFRRIKTETIVERMKELMGVEGFMVDDKAFHHIARNADGSLRDALSLLDQCLAFHYGEELTLEKTLDVLGSVDRDILSRLLRSIVNKDVKEALGILGEIVSQGRDLSHFVNEFLEYMRSVLLIQENIPSEDVLDISIDNMKRIEEESKLISGQALIRYIKIFSELSDKLRYSSQKRIVTEVALVKLCNPEKDLDAYTLAERIARLERQRLSAPDDNQMPRGIPLYNEDGDEGEAIGRIASDYDDIQYATADLGIEDAESLAAAEIGQGSSPQDSSILYQELNERLLRIENRVHRLDEREREAESLRAKNKAVFRMADENMPVPPEDNFPVAINKDYKALLQRMGSLTEKLPFSIRKGLGKARITTADDKIVIVMEKDDLSSALLDEEAIQMLKDCIEQDVNKRIDIEYKLVDGITHKKEDFVDLSRFIDFEIEMMEEDEDG